MMYSNTAALNQAAGFGSPNIKADDRQCSGIFSSVSHQSLVAPSGRLMPAGFLDAGLPTLLASPALLEEGSDSLNDIKETGMTNVISASALSVFNFNSHEVRILIIDNSVWFVASDVAKILEYKVAVKLTRLLDDDEKDVHNLDTPGGKQAVSIINESGMYHAVLVSRKPEAKKFRKWVTSEVLPSIRKTGSYVQTITPAQQREIQKLVADRLTTRSIFVVC